MKRLIVLFAAAAWAAMAQSVPPSTDQIIAAARQDARGAPRFNGAMVVGIPPDVPLLYSLAVSGVRPVTFSATSLPAGLSLDPQTGIITGQLAKAGEYKLKVAAENSAGRSTAEIKVICGGTLALTPPMGWNSYDAFGDNVVEAEVLANARYVAEKMRPFGWGTIVVDYGWYDPGAHDNNRNGRAGAQLAADDYGRLLPATNRFPSAVGGAGFKPLADQIHALGLKFGIHMMRGIPRNSVRTDRPISGSAFTAAAAADTNSRCVWCPDMYGVAHNAAGQAWYDSCLRLWAGWGVDYIKVDDLSRPYHTNEIEMIRRAIAKSGRAIVFSTSPGETPVADADHIRAQANLWRVSDDFWDDWKSLNHQFTLSGHWLNITAPGHWPDADMLPLGHLSVSQRSVGPDRWTRLTPEEQLTHLSLWCLLPSPLMVGANLPDNDPWTLALLTNPEVIAVNQDSLGSAARHVMTLPVNADVWTKPLADHSLAVGLFNRSETAIKLELAWSGLGFDAAPAVRDLWLRKDLPRAETFSAEIPAHGCALLQVSR